MICSFFCYQSQEYCLCCIHLLFRSPITHLTWKATGSLNSRDTSIPGTNVLVPRVAPEQSFHCITKYARSPSLGASIVLYVIALHGITLHYLVFSSTDLLYCGALMVHAWWHKICTCKRTLHLWRQGRESNPGLGSALTTVPSLLPSLLVMGSWYA